MLGVAGAASTSRVRRVPLAPAVALCGSGVGASVAANKGNVIGSGLALELIETFLHAGFTGVTRHERCLAKVHALETGILSP
jgi:ribose 5-phosphate isomerase B